MTAYSKVSPYGPYLPRYPRTRLWAACDADGDGGGVCVLARAAHPGHVQHSAAGDDSDAAHDPLQRQIHLQLGTPCVWASCLASTPLANPTATLPVRLACAPTCHMLSAHPRRRACLGPWQIQALGFVSVYDQIFDGYKWGDAEAIFK